MRSVAWGLLKRTWRRSALISPPAIVTAKRRLHLNRSILAQSSLQSTSIPLAELSTPRLPSQSPAITDDQYLAFINDVQQRSSLRLPLNITQIDAYLHLRDKAPFTLGAVNDEALARLCQQAAIKRLGGVIVLLINDLEGGPIDDSITMEEKELLADVPLQLRYDSLANEGGVFKALPGTKRRLNALQSLVTGASRTRMSSGPEDKRIDALEAEIGFIDQLMSSSILERAFAMLINDYQSLKTKNEVRSESAFTKDLDTRVARRLIRTITKSGDIKLAPVLDQLIRHVKLYDEVDVHPFPQPMEGCNLIEYYLGLDEEANVDILTTSSSSSLSSSEMPQNLQAAYFVLEEMISADPVMVSDTLVNLARQEGEHYTSHLSNEGVSRKEAINKGRSFTLQIVVINILLKKSRFVMLQERLQLLVGDVKKTASDLCVKEAVEIYTRPIRSTINLALTSKTAYTFAFSIAKQFPDIWPLDLDIEGSGALLKALSDCAIQEKEEDELIQLLEVILNHTKPPPSQLTSVALCIGGEAIIAITRRQARIKRRDVISGLLESLRIVDHTGTVISDEIDQLFLTPVRADFIVALAQTGLKEQSRALYERWGAPLDYIVDSDMVQRHIKHVVQTSISVRKPFGHEINSALSEELTTSVKQSSKCLVALVKLFAARPANRNFTPSEQTLTDDGNLNLDGTLTPHKHVQFAYHVLFQYLGDPPTMNFLDRKHFVRLASAYYYLDQRAASFKCFGDIMRREDNPTVEEPIELLRLLARINLERAVELLLERVKYWTRTETHLEAFQDKDNLSRLYSPLLGRCLFKRDYILAEKLLTSARENNLEEHVSLRALNGLVKYAFDRDNPKTSVKVEGVKLDDSRGGDILYLARWVKTLMDKERWRPDPSLLSWLIHRAVAATSIENRGIYGIPSMRSKRYTTYNNRREAAVILLSLSAKYLGHIDVSTASEILRAIQHKMYTVRQKTKRAPLPMELQRLTLEIDKVTKAIRWVQTLGNTKQDEIFEEFDDISFFAPTGHAARTPNQPPVHIFRFLIVAYLRVGDIMGAANIMMWARLEAHLSFEDLEQGWKGDNKGFRNFIKDVAYQTGIGANAERTPRDILGLLSGTNPISRTKSWWDRPEDF